MNFSRFLPSLAPFFVRLAFFGLVWLCLTGSDWASWMVGVPCVLAAAWISAAFRSGAGSSPSLPGMLSLAVYFVRGSLAGACDVAWRVLSPGLPIRPGFVRYKLRIGEGPARWFLAYLLNLLPGTLTADMDESVLTIHALNVGAGLEAELADVEERVARAFGVSLEG